MAVVSLMIVELAKLPTLELVEAEAANGGEEIAFPEKVDLAQHAGFLPAIVNGRETGFEHYFEPISEGALPSEAMAYGTHQIITRTGGDFEEGRAALIYFRIVSRLTGGAYIYPDDAIMIGPISAQDYLAEQIAEYSKYIK